MKKILITLLALTLLCMTAGAQIVDSGRCGLNATWQLEDGGRLVIEGTGAIEDYGSGNFQRPWAEHDVEELVIKEGITRIGDSAFCDFDIKCVSLPSTLESIGEYAFENTGELHSCADLYPDESDVIIPDRETLVIPDSVETIGRGAFSASEAKSIALPKNLKSIEPYLFFDCRELERVTIPDGVETVETYAFAACNELELIVLPKSVKYIGSGAFDDWEDMEGDWGNDYKVTIGYKGTSEEWDEIKIASDNINLDSARIITSYKPGDENKPPFGVILLLAVGAIVVVLIVVRRIKKNKSK